MAYIGNTVENQGFTPAIDYFSGNGVTVTFTLSRPVASVAQVIVAIDNVIQNPNDAFTVAGNAITFSSAPLSGSNNIWVEYTSLITTYQGISQDPTVIGDIRATGGYLAEGDFGNSFVDGAILDYVTGAGRVTVGELDDLVFYHGGTAGRSEMMKVSYAGNSTLVGGLAATGNITTTGSIAAGTATPIRTLTVSDPTSAEFVLQDRSRAANAKNMRLFNTNGALVFGTLNDAGTSGTDYLAINQATGLITGNGRNLSPAMVPVGSVIQTQWNNLTVLFTGNSASYVQVTAFNQTFTPLYASSKVYVTFNTGINLICDGSVALTRNGSIIKDTWFGSSRQDDVNDLPQASGFYLDSPGTASTVTYGIQVRATGCSNIIRIGGTDNHQSWTFMEIAA